MYVCVCISPCLFSLHIIYSITTCTPIFSLCKTIEHIIYFHPLTPTTLCLFVFCHQGAWPENLSSSVKSTHNVLAPTGVMGVIFGIVETLFAFQVTPPPPPLHQSYTSSLLSSSIQLNLHPTNQIIRLIPLSPQLGHYGPYKPRMDVVKDFYGYGHLLDPTFQRALKTKVLVHPTPPQATPPH